MSLDRGETDRGRQLMIRPLADGGPREKRKALLMETNYQQSGSRPQEFDWIAATNVREQDRCRLERSIFPWE